MNFKKNIPNGITLLNLVSGGVSVIMALSGEPACAAWLILLAAVFDFLDGLAARLLNARSAIGGELDSLADVISFGLAPSAILYALMLKSPNLPEFAAGEYQLFPFSALLLAAFAAARLAKFNTDPGQAIEFRGLPTPATGLFVAAFPLMVHYQGDLEYVRLLTGNFYLLLAVVIVLSALMVSSIPLMSLKFKDLSWKGNIYRYVLILSVPLLFIIFRFIAIPLIIILYIILSIIRSKVKSQ
ncbi:MAG TPA: CDP-diacylglycerol--serine O-phosphatidyltransferase [Bacteroidales bacterium]|nr:CDP-diacylglycerol--serine O-phosphatidyltransferase [Bacteroidales bacterium]